MNTYNRRDFLTLSSATLGMLSVSNMTGAMKHQARSHFAPKAKRVIF